MRPLKPALFLAAAFLVLAACADPAPTQPGDEVTQATYTTTSDITVTFVGKVSGEAVYTTCYNGDRLFFWDTYSDGAMAIHPNDHSCAAS